jgi:fructokinase
MRIGVDLGGTKIEALALADDDRVLLRRRVPTPRIDYEATVAAVAELVLSLESDLGTRASVGIGHPGSLSPTTGLIRNANSTALNGRPLDRDLQAALHRELRLCNDANCFAVSEASDGAAAGLRCVFGVILGTGVGGGLAIDARAWVGVNAIAGEWGHNPLPRPRDDERPGPRCADGVAASRRSCPARVSSRITTGRSARAAGTSTTARSMLRRSSQPRPQAIVPVRGPSSATPSDSHGHSRR